MALFCVSTLDVRLHKHQLSYVASNQMTRCCLLPEATKVCKCEVPCLKTLDACITPTRILEDIYLFIFFMDHMYVFKSVLH